MNRSRLPKLLPWLRALFVLLMLSAAAVLAWQVPALRSLNRTISEKKNELDVLRRQVLYQEKISHVHALDDIEAYQQELDALLTPEMDEYLLASTLRTRLVSRKSDLRAELRSLEDEIYEREHPWNESRSDAEEDEDTVIVYDDEGFEQGFDEGAEQAWEEGEP